MEELKSGVRVDEVVSSILVNPKLRELLASLVVGDQVPDSFYLAVLDLAIKEEDALSNTFWGRLA